MTNDRRSENQMNDSNFKFNSFKSQWHQSSPPLTYVDEIFHFCEDILDKSIKSKNILVLFFSLFSFLLLFTLTPHPSSYRCVFFFEEEVDKSVNNSILIFMSLRYTQSDQFDCAFVLCSQFYCEARWCQRMNKNGNIVERGHQIVDNTQWMGSQCVRAHFSMALSYFVCSKIFSVLCRAE